MVALEKAINSALGKKHDLNVDPRKLDEIRGEKKTRIYSNLMDNYDWLHWM